MVSSSPNTTGAGSFEHGARAPPQGLRQSPRPARAEVARPGRRDPAWRTAVDGRGVAPSRASAGHHGRTRGRRAQRSTGRGGTPRRPHSAPGRRPARSLRSLAGAGTRPLAPARCGIRQGFPAAGHRTHSTSAWPATDPLGPRPVRRPAPHLAGGSGGVRACRRFLLTAIVTAAIDAGRSVQDRRTGDLSRLPPRTDEPPRRACKADGRLFRGSDDVAATCGAAWMAPAAPASSPAAAEDWNPGVARGGGSWRARTKACSQPRSAARARRPPPEDSEATRPFSPIDAPERPTHRRPRGPEVAVECPAIHAATAEGSSTSRRCRSGRRRGSGASSAAPRSCWSDRRPPTSGRP
jgi:hypothetical protein